jgi:hypothetical protein
MDSFLSFIERAKGYQYGYGTELEQIRIVFWFDN